MNMLISTNRLVPPRLVVCVDGAGEILGVASLDVPDSCDLIHRSARLVVHPDILIEITALAGAAA